MTQPIGVTLASAFIPVSLEVLGDSASPYIAYMPTQGPPAPAAHDTHLFSDEGLEGCLLCNEWDRDRLAEICAFKVVRR